MLLGTLPAADAYYAEIGRLEALSVGSSRRAWSRVDPEDISRSWRSALTQLVPAFSNLQEQAARAGSLYPAAVLANQGVTTAAAGRVLPGAFAGWSSGGNPIEQLLYTPAIRTKRAIADGHPIHEAMDIGRGQLDAIAQTEVANAGSAAAGVDTAIRPNVGYVRMLSAGACDRCIILAGRWYRYTAGFDRHPNCRCVHIPTRENVPADLTTSPQTYFNSLTEAEQDRTFGADNSQAIRDGADMNRVVNLRQPSRQSSGGVRLTPEDIYARASSREDAVRLLDLNGYIRAA